MRFTVSTLAVCALVFALVITSGSGGEGGSAPTGFVPAPAALPVARGGVQVNLDFTAARSSETQAREDAQDYTVDVVDATSTVDTLQVTRTPGSSLPVDIAGVPVGLIDRQTRTITQVAQEIDGAPSISRDGRYVAFYSSLGDLVYNDANGVADAWCSLC